MGMAIRRFWAQERAEGTSSGALRIAIWIVVALAVIGVVGPKIYSSMSHASTCQSVGTSQTTATYVSGAGTIAGC